MLAAVAAAGWVCSVWLGVLELPAKINSYYAEKEGALANLSPAYDPNRYLGRWTNDPALDPETNVISDRPDSEKQDRGSLQLSITRESDGTFFGELVSAKILETYLPWTAVQLKGAIGSVGGFNGTILEVRANRYVSLGAFKLEPIAAKDGYLEFTASGPATAFVPDHAILWRTEATQSGGESNPNFERLLRKSAAKLLNEREARDEGREASAARDGAGD